MLGVSLRSLLSHKLRLALTTIAVILGVSFVAGTFILTDTINATFTGIFNTADAGVAVTVHGHAIAGEGKGIGGGQNHPVPTSLLATVRAVPGVKDAVGNIFRNGATLIGTNGKPIGGNGPPTIRCQLDHRQRHLSVSPSQREAADAADRCGGGRRNRREEQPCRRAIDRDRLPGRRRAALHHLRDRGIRQLGQPRRRDDRALQRGDSSPGDGHAGEDDSILVSADSGVTDVVLRERIASALPSYAEAETGQQAAQEAEQSTENTISTFIGTPLLVFAFISLFVGSFLIINTFNILVAQRTRELALLRALGATRAQVLTLGARRGGADGTYGVGPRVRCRHSHRQSVAVPFGSASTSRHHAPAAHLIVAVLVGTIVTVVAASLPARRATRIRRSRRFPRPCRRRSHCRAGASASGS